MSISILHPAPCTINVARVISHRIPAHFSISPFLLLGVIVVTCQEFGLTVSEKKTEAMHLWSHPHTTSNALRIEAAGQRYKQTTEFVYLGGAISESADLDIEIKRRFGAAWARVRKYSSQLYDRRNARLSLKIRLFKAEVMEAMLYGCATWTMRS